MAEARLGGGGGGAVGGGGGGRLGFGDLPPVGAAADRVADGGQGVQARQGPGGARLVAEAFGWGARGGVGAGHQGASLVEFLGAEAGPQVGHGLLARAGEEEADGDDLAAGGVGVGGAEQAGAAGRFEDGGEERVERLGAAAVGGDRDPGPGAVGAAGSGLLTLDRGREEAVDGGGVPQGGARREAVGGARGVAAGEPGAGRAARPPAAAAPPAARGGRGA
ncbi:hypothetical protein AB8B12_27810, partial [Streptomyces sp. PGLac3x]